MKIYVIITEYKIDNDRWWGNPHAYKDKEKAMEKFIKLQENKNLNIELIEIELEN